MENGTESILIGDQNIDFLRFENPDRAHASMVEKIRMEILPLGQVQLTNGATHSWPGQANSCLDHVWTNYPLYMSPVSTEWRGRSDHKTVSAVRNSKIKVEKEKYSRKRLMRNFNEADFLEQLSSVNWSDVTNCTNLDVAVYEFNATIRKILDVMAPIRTIQHRKHYAAWLEKDTLTEMDKRDTAQKRASESGSREDWELYKSLRNKCVKLQKLDRRNFDQKRFSQCEEEGNSASLWKLVKRKLNMSTEGPPTSLIVDGHLINSPIKIAEEQNKFYIGKVRKIRSSLPPQQNNPISLLKRCMERWAGPRHFFTLRKISIIYIYISLFKRGNSNFNCFYIWTHLL